MHLVTEVMQVRGHTSGGGGGCSFSWGSKQVVTSHPVQKWHAWKDSNVLHIHTQTHIHGASLVVWPASVLSGETMLLKCSNRAHCAVWVQKNIAAGLIFKTKCFLHPLTLLVVANGFYRQSHLAPRATYLPSSSCLHRTSLINNSLSELLTVKHTLPGSSSSTPFNLKWYRHLADLDHSSIKRISWGGAGAALICCHDNLLNDDSCQFNHVAHLNVWHHRLRVGGLESRNHVWCWLSNPADYICLYT